MFKVAGQHPSLNTARRSFYTRIGQADVPIIESQYTTPIVEDCG